MARAKRTGLFWDKVKKSRGCWVWTAGKNAYGYGAIRRSGKTRMAHRVAYEMKHGSIPNNLPLDHLCRNRACVRPSHLEPVSLGENLLRGNTITARNKARTHCPQGHPYSKDNTYIRRLYCRCQHGRRGNGVGRWCKICARFKSKWFARRKILLDAGVPMPGALRILRRKYPEHVLFFRKRVSQYD